jgi:hypothetical protein
LLAHPDVRRMLLTQRAYTEAGRAFARLVGVQLDRAKYGDDAGAQAFAELLTPVAKAFLTDRGMECALLAQQILGGHGYIAEWGIEQVVRDARIAQIYEGTNGIQAMDLIGRKVLKDGGHTLGALLDSLQQQARPGPHAAAVEAAFHRLTRITQGIVQRAAHEPALPGALATDYLDLVGLTLYAWLWNQMAAAAPADGFGADKLATARFFFARLLPRTLALEAALASSAAAVMDSDF